MTLTIATWNINSLRHRLELVVRFLKEEAPDVLCLQETKAPVEKLPLEPLAALGYGHAVTRGQKGYNGVAILSRLPIEDAGDRNFCARGDARHVTARLPGDVLLHNVYLPAGGDVPDPVANPKFAHKLAFMEEMRAWFAAEQPHRAILVGDLNIAPLEHDVWSHKQLLDVVSHTPVEVEALTAWQRAGEWHDALRHFVPADQKLYTWWSYRARDWEAANRGRRLDHVWVSQDLAGKLRSHTVLKPARSWAQCSDHVPVLVELDL